MLIPDEDMTEHELTDMIGKHIRQRTTIVADSIKEVILASELLAALGYNFLWEFLDVKNIIYKSENNKTLNVLTSQF